MSVIERIVSDREVGQLPVSISTSLAFESAFGIHTELVHPKAPILDTDRILVNIRTLIRNVHGAINGDAKHSVPGENLAEAVIEEMDILTAAIEQVTKGSCKLSFYACSLQSLRDRFPGANLRLPNGSLQENYAGKELRALKAVTQMRSGLDLFNVGIEKSYPDRTLIITHHPVDLLDHAKFRQLKLLESHTGNIKTKPMWTTKLTNGRALTRIPFNRITLQIFGDNNNLFTQMPVKVRQAVVEMAEEKKWNSITTQEKIVFDAGYHKDPLMKVLINQLK